MKNMRSVWCIAFFAVVVCSWTGCARQPIEPAEIEARFAPVKAYHYGASRAPLLELERFIHSHAGDAAAMSQLERRLIGLAKSDAAVEARAFACEQLGFIGGAASARPLAELLDDKALTFQARQALQRIPDPAAGRVLSEAMQRSDGAAREALRQTLVARGDLKATVAKPAMAKKIARSTAAPATLGELLERMKATDPGAREDAAVALERLPDPEVDDAMAKAAMVATPEVRARSIAALAARGARGCTPLLLQWAKDDPDENVRVAALEALGKVGGPEEMPKLVALFASSGSPKEERSAQDALWALYRRAGKANELKAAIDGPMATAPPPKKETLQKMLFRAEALARSPGPTADTLIAEPTPTGEGDPIFPDGHRLIAYNDCGMDDVSGGGGGAVIRVAQGKGYRFGGRDPVRSAVFDPKQIRFDVTGLRDDGAYVLGLTWWDADGKGRKQSVHVGSGEPVAWRPVMPATAPIAFHAETSVWARVPFPVPAGTVKSGGFKVAVNCEAGPNAVVSEVWVLEALPGPARKRVLIVCGDDHRAHRWRETAPAFAEILRADPRLEVTITESPAMLGSPLLSHYDAAMIHFKNYGERLPLGQDVWRGLEAFASSGKGVVLAHFGCGAFEDWDGFAAVAGRIWDKTKRGHDPYGDFRVLIKDAGHPITAGMSDFETADELYTCLKGDAAIRVLCAATSKIDKKDHPMAFVSGADKLRVFHCTLGHDMASLNHEGTRNLYRRGVAWACGLGE